MSTTTRSRTVVPESHQELLEHPIIAHLATVRPDGSPQSNPVWFEWDGEHVKISQTRARQKLRNLGREPRVSLSITDPDDPYRYLEVRAEVNAVEDDAHNAFIDHLSQQYLGTSPYPGHQPGDERVIVRLRPVDASTMG